MIETSSIGYIKHSNGKMTDWLHFACRSLYYVIVPKLKKLCIDLYEILACGLTEVNGRSDRYLSYHIPLDVFENRWMDFCISLGAIPGASGSFFLIAKNTMSI